MRFFAFMLSIVVLVLSCMPCADAVGGCIGSHQTITASQAHNQANGFDPCNDNCSPFCSCSCCSGFTITNYVVLAPGQFVATFKPDYNKYLFAEIPDISFPVWQPPQIV